MNHLGINNSRSEQLSPTYDLFTAGRSSIDLVPKSQIGKIFTHFKPISLEETNNKAKMLNRVDKKYVVDYKQFKTALEGLATRYAVLEIDQRNHFTYASCYYDDQFRCYYEHHQARRQRVKVRTREYVDCGLKFFEIKLKGLRGRTNKRRIKCDQFIMPNITGDCLKFLQDAYSQQYKKPMKFDFKPSLIVDYTRVTLVAQQGSERVTIDYGLKFRMPRSDSPTIEIDNDFIIIETKSKDGIGFVDQKFKKSGIRKASKCSKYCIGAILTDRVQKKNTFLPAMRRIGRNVIVNASQELQVTP